MEYANGIKAEIISNSSENKTPSERSSNSAPASPCESIEMGSNRGKRKVYKHCAVCGDKALGFNFDAVTCESCKAFFRRNALKDEIPKCIFDQKCKVDINTRRFCTFCRLQKCFQAGMKKYMILDDNQKRQRMEKVQQNRQRRLTVVKGVENVSTTKLSVPASVPISASSVRAATLGNQPASNSSASSTSSVSSSVSPVSATAAIITDAVDAPINNLVPAANIMLSQIDCLQTATADTGSCLSDVKGDASSVWESVVGVKSGTDNAASATRTATVGPSENDFTYDAMTAISAAVFSGGELPSSSSQHFVSLNQELTQKSMARLLTQEEWSAVSDLTDAYKSSFLETSDKMPERKCSLINLVNTSGFIVRKLINFAKKLSDFTNLPQPCQIALLKGVVLNTLFVRSATHFDPDLNVWNTPRGQVPASILCEATGYRDLYEEHGKFCRQFLTVIDNDENLVPLLQVLSLFSPDRPLLGEEHQRVSDIQDRYICLIKHYLEARHGYVVARCRFQEVLMCVGSLQALTDSHGKILLHVNPNEVDPLMLEVFDLKATLLHDGDANSINLPSGAATNNGFHSNSIFAKLT